MDFSAYGTKVTYFTFMNFVDPKKMAEIAELLLECHDTPLLIAYRDMQFYIIPGDSQANILTYFEECVRKINLAKTINAAQIIAMENLSENGQNVH